MYKPDNNQASINTDAEQQIMYDFDDVDTDGNDEDNFVDIHADDALDETQLNLMNFDITPNFETEVESLDESQAHSIEKLSTNVQIPTTINQVLLATEVTITAEVARINLTMQEFIHLQIGDKLPLANLPASVKLWVNGKCIAEGILVEINQRVGVKITRIIK